MNKTYLYLILVIVSTGVTYLSKNYIITDNVLIEHFGQQLSIDRIEQLLDFRNEWSWLSYATLPIIYLLKFTLLTLWLLCGIILFSYKTSFKKIFQVVLMSEFVWIVPSFLTIIWFGLIDTNYTLTDVQYFEPWSLMSFFDEEGIESWLIFPLKSLNLFELVYMLVLAFGLRKVINRDYNTSLSFVAPVYGLGLVTWIVFITFLSINLSS